MYVNDVCMKVHIAGRWQTFGWCCPVLCCHCLSKHLLSRFSSRLGVILDQELRFSLHINKLTCSCYYQLRQLRVVSRSLSCSAAAALVHAFVTSRLDHCSSILVGLPLALTARLDRVLRCAAHLIVHILKYASVSTYMCDMLHWLPIAQRISYR